MSRCCEERVSARKLTTMDIDDQGEEDNFYQRPISALAPRLGNQEENAVEVSASPAFQCLDEVRH